MTKSLREARPRLPHDKPVSLTTCYVFRCIDTLETTAIPWALTEVAHVHSSKPIRKVRYAVVGLGYISQIAVLPAFAHARENCELSALVSGDPQKLKILSRKYKVKHTYSYQSYGDCLNSGEIDAVYIALPNNMHRAYAESAARAGIHVLCEKPMAIDESECEAMLAAAENARVKLMIAYRLHFEPANLEAIRVVNSGRIGEPRIFTSVFSQQVKAGNSRLKKEAGGAIYDMGVYCINAARYLFRAEPEEVFAWNMSSSDERFAEVPEMTAGLLRFPGDRIASFMSSFGASDRSVFEVIGSEGVLKLEPAYEMTQALKSEITINGRTIRKVFQKRDQFAPELVYFSNCILKNKQPEPSGQEGLADVRVVRALLESVKAKRPVSVSPVSIRQRPDPAQKITKEPLAKRPHLVRAAAPGAD
jgi:predicted dehydrogenase